ncbi:tyrosine-type recombinase/integrase [Mycobacterium canetti]|uniref:tyrosine-type recombinase/integrase n=1 Tax=Mycobacterium canetti TaxID=78331 RepID=UPI0002A54CD1|nr:tyrosine-type recombinase/integrase [Mycobacterium canetti]CCK64830.1 Putative integrase (Phage integrase family protein) [Mycobacterium canettii CIPT 140070017]
MNRNDVRTNRARAKRLGLRVAQRGTILEVWADGADSPLVAGSVEAISAWLSERAVHRPPGLAPAEAPPAWRPWLDLFVAEQNAAHRSPNSIRTRLQHLIAFAYAHPDETPLTITRDQLREWVGDRTRKPRTAHSIRSTMRVFFGILYDLDHRRDNPARTLPPISLPRSLPRPCPDHAVRQAYESIVDERLVLAVRITVETGMRRAEVVHVHPSDVEGRTGDFRLHVVGKGGHERTIPISDGLAEAILGFSGYLFAGRDGEPITPRHLGKLISRALPAEWTMHTLRHRFATVASQATNDLRPARRARASRAHVTGHHRDLHQSQRSVDAPGCRRRGDLNVVQCAMQ